jgi:PAS domain S-box-containing protein
MDVFRFRSPQFWTVLICLLFAMMIALAAIVTNVLRNDQFESRFDNIHRKDLSAMERVQTELTQQALLTAHLVKENQNLVQLLIDAAQARQNGGTEDALLPIRTQLHQIAHPYWTYLQQRGVKQLHFHLAPNAFTFYRAHRPDFHSDILADVRPLVMEVLNSARPQSGLEVGRHGIGLRAVLPLIVAGEVIAAIEVGYGLAGVLTLNQDAQLPANNYDTGIAFIVNKTVLEVLNEKVRDQFTVKNSAAWVTEHEFLNQTTILQQIPEKIEKPVFLQIQSDSKQFLLTLMPWYQFGATALDAEIVLTSWQDVTQMHQEKIQTDLMVNLIWLMTLVVGVLLVYFISKKLQESTAAVITAQQKDLLWSQQKLNALFELSPDSILLNRFSDGVYLDANPAMTELTGYTFDELKQLSYFDLTPQIYEQQEKEQLRQLNETGRYGPYRKQYRHKNGELVDIELRGVKFTSPSGEPMIWSTITDRRESMKLERLKTDFISTVSHELRTPLTSVNGSLDLLLSGAAGELPPKAQKLLGIAVKNNKRLIALVNDLLDIEKLSQGKLAFKPEFVSSQTLIKNAIENNLPFAELHNVSLRLGQIQDVPLYIDADRILQVMANLISNAAKFSPADSDVLIHSQLKPHVIRIAVTDQGRGLTAEQISKLFERFSQLDNSSNKEQPGSGLGLAISREIIAQSGGQIGVESEPGVGSTFWIELPLAEKTVLPVQKKRILVVEDDADTAFTLKELLQASGYDVDVAHEVKQAWLLLQRRQYDLVTLDLNLNGESGGEFFLKLRDTADFAKIPVLVISAFIEQGKLLLNAIAHTVDWLEKPVNTDLLRTKIEYLLSQSGTQLTSARILHVEDDDDIVSIMQMQLECKFHYHHAGNLAEARAKLRSNRYDLVLLDIGLPDGNGWQLIPDLQLYHAKVPVIVFSAQDVSVNQRNQATAVFGKTKVEPSALVEQISQMLGVK